MSIPVRTIALFIMVAAMAPAAHAQIFENVGTRAQGMGGAFVAVADDATATWWNPAGLAAGPYFNVLLDYNRLEAREGGLTGVAIAFPALGLSYYRLPINQMQGTTSTGLHADSRQDERVLSVFGMTVGQSLGDHLVVASTLKLERSGDTAGDLDVGALARFGWLQFGLTARNLREPTLTGDLEPLKVERQARAGLALIGSTQGIVSNATLAVDADLMTTGTPWGDVRHAAAGVEAWLFGRRLGIRAGAGGNTIGARRATASGGLSLMLTAGAYVRTYVDGQVTRGSDDNRRGWSASLRATF
jgi:hypothetical protein